MTPQVEPFGLDVMWEPNAPEAALIVRDAGETTLALEPHPSDSDRRRVVLSWTGTAYASMSEPNDEALAGHPLYNRGLADVRWIGIVQDSELIEELEARNRVHPGHMAAGYASLTHYVLPLKESTVEVVASGVEVHRDAAATLRIPPN